MPVAEFDKERHVPRLSIVITCPGGAAEFEGTLVSVLQNRPADCEVLVVHGEPYDDPYALDSEVRFIRGSGAGFVPMANAGLQQATGDVIHMIGCDVTAQEGWADAALAHFDDEDVAAVSPIVLAGDGQRVHSAGLRWTLGGARKIVSDQRALLPGAGRLRSRILGPALTAGFYRREVLAALGGFDGSLGETLADVDMALAIRELGLLHVCEPGSRLLRCDDSATVSAGGFSAGRSAERVFWRYAATRGTILAAGFHGATVVADALRQAPQLGALTSLIGRAIALCEIGAKQRQQQRLAAASEQLAELNKLRSVIRMPVSGTRPGQVATSSQRRAA